jgi:hypothetical protein
MLEKARIDIWDRPDENRRKGQRPKSVGQLLRKSKWEKPLADWRMATGVGFLGPENHDLEAERVGEMMDGDASYSSEIKLLTFRRDVRLFLCFSFSFVVLSSHCHVHLST